MSLTEEQKARINANREKALAIRAEKERQAQNTIQFNIVGRQYYSHTNILLTPDVPINVTPNELNPNDKNAHKVCK